jgi:hypothetical protein
MLRVPLVVSVVELATGSGCASSWSSSPSPNAGLAQLLGHDLDRTGAAALSGPCAALAGVQAVR